MLHLIVAAVLGLISPGEVPLTAGTQLNYRGTVEARGEEPTKAAKTFELTVWITHKSDAAAEIFWLVDEQGRGEFPWTQRFGRQSLDGRWQSAAEGPAVIVDRGETRGVVSLPPLFLQSEQPLAADATFKEGPLEFHVDRATKVGEQPAWKVSVRDQFGPKRTLSVDQRSPLVLVQTDKSTIGRGEEQQTRLELAGSSSLDRDQLSALLKVVDRLIALRGKLNQPARAQEVHWNKEQLDLLKRELPPLAELALATPLSKLVEAAHRDLMLQSGRDTAVDDLATKYVGQPVENLALKGIDGDSLNLGDLAGHVTVLHFWDYRDEPLKEPYGQVGYLDFMYHRRKPQGLAVYGVAMDGRLADEKTRPAAERSAKKLKAFMNLSYPLLMDTDGTIKKFGDPRLVGASLPLFIVIGPDKTILHYHAGFYQVTQDQGLKELDQVVAKALEGLQSSDKNGAAGEAKSADK